MTQQRAAKIAGLLYLATMATSIFAYAMRARLIVRGDAAQTAANILADEPLFRLGTVLDIVTVAGVVPLIWALYVVLKPVDRDRALLAAFWRLVECAVMGAAIVSDFTILALLNLKQSHTLAYTLFRVRGAGFNIAFVFLGLGSALFSVLWWKSRYLPRALAAWGVVASLLLAIVTVAIMLFPPLAAVSLQYMAPMFVYEVGLGLWLLFKPLRT